MPSISVYVSDELKARMDDVKGQFNWSAIVQAAIRTTLKLPAPCKRSSMNYVTFDYEEVTGSPADNFWHIYTFDAEPPGVEFGHSTLLTIVGPKTEAMRAAMVQVCQAIDHAISLALLIRTPKMDESR